MLNVIMSGILFNKTRNTDNVLLIVWYNLIKIKTLINKHSWLKYLHRKHQIF